MDNGLNKEFKRGVLHPNCLSPPTIDTTRPSLKLLVLRFVVLHDTCGQALLLERPSLLDGFW